MKGQTMVQLGQETGAILDGLGVDRALWTDGSMPSVTPLTGEQIGMVRVADAAAVDETLGKAQRGVPCMAPRARTAPRRAGPSVGRGIARGEGRSGKAGDDRGGQDPVRGCRRSAGDDRCLRLCGRAFPAIIRPDHRDRAAGTPDDGSLASAGRRRRDFGVQLSGRGVGMERRPGARLRQQRRMETVRKDAADRARGAGGFRARDGAVRRCARRVGAAPCRRTRGGRGAGRRQARRAGVGDGLDADGPRGGAAARRAVRARDPRTRWQ